VQRAEEFARVRGAPGRAPGGRPTRRHEEWLETPDEQAGGYIDQIEESDEGPILRDFKTGEILDADSAEAGGSLKEAYLLQLQLYAAIFARATGAWPVRLELVPLQGAPREIGVDQEACQALLEEALCRLRAINAVVAAHPSAQAEAELASPSADTCRFCLYRPACSAYRSHDRSNNDGARWPDDLWGIVREKRILGNGKVLLIVTRERPGLRDVLIRGLNPNEDRNPALPVLGPGQPVAAFGLAGAPDNSSYTESRWTVLYQL
jgi:hypothetical protein